MASSEAEDNDMAAESEPQSTSGSDAAAISPRVFPSIEELDARLSAVARRATATDKYTRAAIKRLHDDSTPLPWSSPLPRSNSMGTSGHSEHILCNSLDDAARFMGWTVMDGRTGRGLHSFPCQLNLSSSVHLITGLNS
jgi:hypothetical protein